MDPGVLTALITSGGLLIGGTVAVFVKRGSDGESARTTGSNAFLDQLQEQGALDRAAAAAARAEADTARTMLADAESRFRSEMSGMWQQMDDMRRQMEEMRIQHRADLQDDDDYIAELIDNINQRVGPPVPVRPNRRSTGGPGV